MNRTTLIPIAAALAAALPAAPAAAAPMVGQPAPDFTLSDAAGKPHRLSAYRGRTVVVEWNNPGCPYVQKHYNSGNMQKTQAAARAAGAVWLTVNSGAPGKQGHMNGAEAQRFVARMKAQPTAYLLDPAGQAGRLYRASTTPELFIVDPKGTLVYKGAIDDRPTADPADLAGARNYIRTALSEMRAGKPVSTPETRSYGCAVKYAS